MPKISRRGVDYAAVKSKLHGYKLRQLELLAETILMLRASSIFMKLTACTGVLVMSRGGLYSTVLLVVFYNPSPFQSWAYKSRKRNLSRRKERRRWYAVVHLIETGNGSPLFYFPVE